MRKSNRFSSKARYIPYNDPRLTDRAVAEMIGMTIRQHLAGVEGKILGLTWQERFPEFGPWLTGQGITPEGAVDLHERWQRRELSTWKAAETVAVVPFDPDSALMMEVAIVKPIISARDLLSGRATIFDIPSPQMPQANGRLVDEVSEARHSSDFASVYWFGTQYTFTTNQAPCVRVLWEAWNNRTPVLSIVAIIEEAGVSRDDERLDQVFRKHPAWGTMIKSPSKGKYCLQVPNATT